MKSKLYWTPLGSGSSGLGADSSLDWAVGADGQPPVPEGGGVAGGLSDDGGRRPLPPSPRARRVAAALALANARASTVSGFGDLGGRIPKSTRLGLSLPR